MRNGTVCALAAAFFTIAIAGATWAGGASAPRWQPDPAQLSQLVDQDNVTAYTIQLPKGAAPKHQEMDTPGMIETQYVWSVGKDMYILATVTNQRSTDPLPDPATALDDQEHATVESCPNAVRTKKETGNVDGLAATRDRFTYTSPDSPHTKMAGFNYAVKTGTTLVIAGAITADASKATDLPLAEAAILTLLKSVAKSR